MTDTEPYYNVELGAACVEQHGLGDRIAHGFELPGTQLLSIFDSNLLLGNCACLTDG